ncbi:MAG TPA: LysR family transcriptional regulator [Gemmatimonadaceae bacterium]|jgi:LysR family transcriptional activator of nhaA
MAWLNYHHLLYFWTVAREGSIARASAVLNLTQPAISSQLRTLEKSLGEKLFQKSGRNLVLTDTGRLVFRYADEIFSTGRELMEALRGQPTGRPARLVVGATDAMPKIMVHRLLEPALRLAEPVHLVVRDDKPERLLASLSIHELDLVIADAPMAPTVRVRAFNHLLGESPVSLVGTPALVAKYKRRFPASLDGAPFIMPTEDAALRRALEQAFADLGVSPRVVAEIADSAVLGVFGQEGLGLFATPTVIAEEVCRQHGLRVLGPLDGVTEKFYAISVERRITHPAVLAISASARQVLD